MERDLREKNIIITGGAKGIGLSIAENFLYNGAKTVILLDIDDKEGNAAADKLNNKLGARKAVFVKCDVTKDLENVFDKIISAHKVIDVLVNNAGWARETSIRDTLELNVIAVVEWSMRFIEHMRRDTGGRGGTIINMSSIFGFQASKYSPFYSTSKHAILGFTKSKGHADTFVKTGVRMIALCPGFTRTNIVDTAVFPSDLSAVAIGEFCKSYVWQETSAVGEAAVEFFKIADSGSAWVIEGEKPIYQKPT